MFHYTNFGSFGNDLKRLADMDGYVPEEGDNPEDFNFPHDHFLRDFDDNEDGYEGYAMEKWEAHTHKAIEATREASAALEAWRESNA